MTSLVYRSTAGYELVMRALYGRHYEARLRVVAAQVPDGSSVLELCCGPGTLYRRHLRGRVSDYIGLDVNAGFVERLRRQGIDARRVDLAADTTALPAADVVVMQASLYHFLPDPRPILERMRAAARERVVISEPIRNLASSGLPLLGALGRRATDPGAGGHAARFDERSLDRVIGAYEQLAAFTAPGGREKVFVLAAAGPGRSAPRLPGRSGTTAVP